MKNTKSKIEGLIFEKACRDIEMESPGVSSHGEMQRSFLGRTRMDLTPITLPTASRCLIDAYPANN